MNGLADDVLYRQWPLLRSNGLETRAQECSKIQKLKLQFRSHFSEELGLTCSAFTNDEDKLVPAVSCKLNGIPY